MSSSSRACARLARDLKEVQSANDLLTRISAHPVSEDNLFEWRVNVFLGDEDEDDVETCEACHLILRFPVDYPTAPPSVEVCTPYPHASIIFYDGRFSLCLDMLDTVNAKSAKPYAGWSSAYSVLSILLQLRSEWDRALAPRRDATRP